MVTVLISYFSSRAAVSEYSATIILIEIESKFIYLTTPLSCFHQSLLGGDGGTFCVQARGQPQVLFLGAGSSFCLSFETVSLWGLGLADEASPALLLQVALTTPVLFVLLFYRSVGIELWSCACTPAFYPQATFPGPLFASDPVLRLGARST